jgi:hypothetical protein
MRLCRGVTGRREVEKFFFVKGKKICNSVCLDALFVGLHAINGAVSGVKTQVCQYRDGAVVEISRYC